MSVFQLHLQSAAQYELIEGVSSFVGEDSSGSFGIQAHHVRSMASLGFGLARYRCGEQAMGDFLGHYPQSLPGGDADFEIILLIGSERGFCGDFNESLLAGLTAAPSAQRAVVAVGEKLGKKLEEARIPAETMAGLTTAEDVPDALLAVVDKLRELNTRHGTVRLSILHNHYDGHTIALRRLRPFLDYTPETTLQGYPPLLNVSPQTFFQELIDHYLFAVLHGVLYSSLAAEHQLRLRHLQGTIEHINKQCAATSQRYNSLRQELITEEIELIVLSAGTCPWEQ